MEEKGCIGMVRCGSVRQQRYAMEGFVAAWSGSEGKGRAAKVWPGMARLG
jgi:hypothetical protein